MRTFKIVASLATIVFHGDLYGQPESNYRIRVSELRMVAASDNDAPGVKQDIYHLTFTGSIRNSDKRAIPIPEGPLFLTITEIQLPTGEWKTILGAPSLIGIGVKKQQRCVSVKPGTIFTLNKLSGMVTLEKGSTNGSTYIRFHYSGECLDAAIWRISKFVTEPISIDF